MVKNYFSKIKNFFKPKVTASNVAPAAPAVNTYFDGSKFFGGFGYTELQTIDYWTLRARSAQLFNDNLYAKGLIRRLVTNEINTGLNLEAMPEETTIGVPEDSLNDWSENIENRFTLYGNSPRLCDSRKENTLPELQRVIRRESLINGDVLIILTQSEFQLPQVEIVSGNSIQTPYNDDYDIPEGHKIREGVELDAKKRQVAYFVAQDDGTFKRVSAYGRLTGRRIAWLVYGTEHRHEEVRGQPLLSIVLQSLKEVDRYRDAALRKAVVNSILAMFIKKSQDKMGTMPVTGASLRKASATATDPVDGGTRTFNIASQIPGVVFEELQQGEEPVGFDSQVDVNFGKFEEAIIQALAWANEIPPEILRLAFSNNYSASQAAINEFKIYLNLIRSKFGSEFNQILYVDWLISETLLGKIEVPGFLDSWRDPLQYDIYAAWISSDWSGAIKPSTDTKKLAQGYKEMVGEGWMTNDRAARELSGTKFTKNAKRIKRENELKVEMARPLAEFKQEFSQSTEDDTTIDDDTDMESTNE